MKAAHLSFLPCPLRGWIPWWGWNGGDTHHRIRKTRWQTCGRNHSRHSLNHIPILECPSLRRCENHSRLLPKGKIGQSHANGVQSLKKKKVVRHPPREGCCPCPGKTRQTHRRRETLPGQHAMHPWVRGWWLGVADDTSIAYRYDQIGRMEGRSRCCLVFREHTTHPPSREGGKRSSPAFSSHCDTASTRRMKVVDHSGDKEGSRNIEKPFTKFKTSGGGGRGNSHHRNHNTHSIKTKKHKK